MADFSALQAQLPQVLARRSHKMSHFFTVEELDLKFSNGTQMTYERLGGSGSSF